MYFSFSATVLKQHRFSMIRLGGRTWRQVSSAYKQWLMGVVRAFSCLWMTNYWDLFSQL